MKEKRYLVPSVKAIPAEESKSQFVLHAVGLDPTLFVGWLKQLEKAEYLENDKNNDTLLEAPSTNSMLILKACWHLNRRI